jgi:hypothetical protein
VAGVVLWPALSGDRALVGVHTGTLSPWRAALTDAERAEVEAASRPLLADKTIQFQPMLQVSLERMAAGQIPAWNDRNLSGVPLLAQGFHGPFHPVNWLAALLPPERAFGWMAWAQALLAGLGAWALVRALGVSALPALLAGVGWMLCGYVTSRWHWYMIQGCTAWLPWALLGVERLCMATRPRPPDHPPRPGLAVATTALAIGMAWLTGWMQGALHLMYVTGIWAAARLAPALLAGGERRVAAKAASGRCALAVVFGLMLAGPQFLPTLEWVGGGESARDVEPIEAVRALGMEPAGLLGLLSPDNLGHPVDLATHPAPELRTDGALRRLLHKPSANFVESHGFVGVVVLLLAFAGAGSRGRGRWLGVGLGLGGLLLAMDTPVLLAVGRLPGLSSSSPLRFLMLWSLGAVLLSALGLQRVTREGATRRVVALAALLSLAAVGLSGWLASLDDGAWADVLVPRLATALGVPEAEVALRGPTLGFDRDLAMAASLQLTVVSLLATLALLLTRKNPAQGALCLLGLAVVELVVAGQKSAVTVPAAHLFEAPPALEALQAGGRLVPVHPPGVADPLGGAFPGNAGLAHGVDDTSGYYALAPRRIVNLIERIQPGTTFDLGFSALVDPVMLASPALAALGVNQALSSDASLIPGWRAEGAVGDAWHMVRDAPVPRAWFSTGRAVSSDAVALDELLALDAFPMDGRVTTPLSPGDGFTPPTQQARTDPTAPVAVTVTTVRPEHLELTVEAPCDGVVVLAQTWSPGWTARLDGADTDTPIWPAWSVLQAIEVPAGSHTISLRYDAPGFRKGAVLAALALLGLAGCLISSRRRPSTP